MAFEPASSNIELPAELDHRAGMNQPEPNSIAYPTHRSASAQQQAALVSQAQHLNQPNDSRQQAGDERQNGQARPMTDGTSMPKRAPLSQAAIAMQFYSSLRTFLTLRNVPIPPNLFTMEPADPNIPGSTPTPIGAFDIFGKKVDLLRLYIGIAHIGGYMRTTALEAWPKVAQSLGLSSPLPAPYNLPRRPDAPASEPPRTSTQPSEVISNVYQVFLLGFEENNRLQSGAQGARSASGQHSNIANNQEVASTSESASYVRHNEELMKESTLQNENPSERQAWPVTLDNGSISIADSKPLNLGEIAEPTVDAISSRNVPRSIAANPGRSDTEILAVRQRLLLQAQQKAMMQNSQMQGPIGDGQKARSETPMNHSVMPQDPPVGNSNPAITGSTPFKETLKPSDVVADHSLKRKLSEGETDSVSNTILARSPSTQNGSMVSEETKPRSPKRVRHKIEYRPLSRTINTYGGWDLNALTGIRIENARARTTLAVEDLGRVDIETLCMSLRSGINSEISYALTVLDMLSMPGKGDDKGGLGLIHCGELLTDLVDLVEEQTFGENGWRAWSTAISTDEETTTTLNAQPDFCDARIVAAEHLANGCLPSRPPTRSTHRAEIVLVTSNLLRNFSMMNDNYSIMSRHPTFISTMIQLCDDRLVHDVSHRINTISIDATSFSTIEMFRIREDVLDVLHALSASLDLTILPWRDTRSIINLVTSHLSDHPSSSERLLHLGDEGLEEQEQTLLAVETLAQLSTSDINRVVLRRLTDAEIERAFIKCLKHLAFGHTHPAPHRRGSPWLDFQYRIVVCIYNLAFLAPFPVRTILRESSGTISVIALAMQFFQKLPRHTLPSLIARRLSETLGILNGTNDLVGEGEVLTFGSNASVRGVRGWTDDKQIAETGLLASRQEALLMDMVHAGRVTGDMDEITFREVSRAVWAE